MVLKKDEHTSELRKQPRGSHLEKEDSQERESCVWRRKIERREQVWLPLRKIISLCVRVEKKKRDFSLAVRYT